jgi:ubiquinone/menaquinone biosynthesis C-methylase UbiE
MSTEKSKKDIEHFSRWSRTYDSSWIRRLAVPVHQDMLEVAASIVPAPRSILDIGCGTGKLLIKAAARWPSAELVGVDPAVGMVEVARNQAKGATIYLGQAESLPVADSSIDIVFSSLSFHHWDDQAKALREITRALRPGGCLCITDITLPDWIANVIRRIKVKGPAGMARLFTEGGFAVRLQRRSSSRFVLLTLGIVDSRKA